MPIFAFAFLPKVAATSSPKDKGAKNGRGMAVSPDGKQVAMAGGGGWRSKTDQRANYAIAVFDTATMESLNGQIDTGPYPNNIAFHPVLKLGAAFNGKDIVLFQSKSFVKKGNFPGSDNFSHSGYLLFGGRGTKVIQCSYNAAVQKPSVLKIYSLTLSTEEKALLQKAYPGKTDSDETDTKPDTAASNYSIRQKGYFANDVNCGQSQDGDTVIAAGDGALIQWFSLPAGKKVAEIKTGHDGGIGSVAITPDGKFLATGSLDSTLKVWDLGQKKETASIQMKRKGFPCVALTPDAKKCFTAGLDLLLWELRNKEFVSYSIQGPVHGGLAVAPEGKRAAWVTHSKKILYCAPKTGPQNRFS